MSKPSDLVQGTLDLLILKILALERRLPVRPEIYLPLSFNGGGPPVVER